MLTINEPSPKLLDLPPSTVVRPPDHLPTKGILRSEWTKLKSVRSTWWTLASTMAIMVGFGALLSAAFVSHLDARDLFDFDATFHSLQGLFLAQLTIGVLGVLAVTNEYATGMIRNTFGAVPQRKAVLTAKLAVFAAIALVVTEIASFAAFFVGQAILHQKNLGVSITDPGVLRGVLGTGVYLTAIGILGMAFGALLRRTSGAIATLFGLVLVLPLLAQALPSPWSTNVTKILPAGAGQAIVAVRHSTDSLSPGIGLVVLCGYIAVALTAAFVTLQRRDA